MKAEQYQGKVKQYNADKGFGFISSPEGDVFFHISDFLQTQVSRNAMNA
jgi:CspA family cold shock protein